MGTTLAEAFHATSNGGFTLVLATEIETAQAHVLAWGMKGDDADPKDRILQLVRALALFDIESATTSEPTFTNTQ